MDNLTHSAVGLFLARAGLGRWSPQATGIVLLAANSPDVDVVSAAGGPLNYLHFHRYWTHSIAAMPLMALASVAVVRLAGRKPVYWVGAFFAALLGVASHLVLDWTNVYGIRLLLPFSGEWLRGDITGVIDLVIWSICLLGIAGPFLGRLVGSEITSGTVRPRHHGRGWAWFALLCILLYDGGRVVLHSRAMAVLGSRLYQDSPPLRVAALPTPSPMKWRGLIETSSAWFVEEVNLAVDSSAARATVYHKPDAEPALDAARASPAVREFLRFSQCPLWRVTPYPEKENARLVEVFDMRFGTPAAPGFMARAVVDGRQQIDESSFQFGAFRPR
jgi:inner membrane protein